MIFDASFDGRTVRVEVRGGPDRYEVTLDGRPLVVDQRRTGAHFVSLLVDGRSYEAGLSAREGGYSVVLTADAFDVDLREAARGDAAAGRSRASGPVRLTAPMPGKIVKVLAAAGAAVEAGQGLLVMEAMKMENELRAPRKGRVREIHVAERQAVETGALLLVLE